MAGMACVAVIFANLAPDSIVLHLISRGAPTIRTLARRSSHFRDNLRAYLNRSVAVVLAWNHAARRGIVISHALSI